MYGDKMEKIRFQICEKELTLYPAQGENRPLIVFNTVMGDGEELAQAMRAMDAPDCNLLVVGKLQWYHDMTPWSCPPLSKRGPAATGGADAYLETLASEIVPAARKKIRGSAPYVGIAGYSLAGLFALYAMYRCDCFARVASMSGSLWFPKFREYVLRCRGEDEACGTENRAGKYGGDRQALSGGRRGCALGAEPRKSLPGRGDAKRKRYQGDTGSVKNELRL